MLRIVEDNIFTSRSQVLVNTVNCVGYMGRGVALEFRIRYPDMFEQYKLLCEDDSIAVGKLWIYKSGHLRILNFPTKHDYKHPSKIEYIEEGLQKFVDTYKDKAISQVAFPLLGSDNGGLDSNTVIEIMKKYLEPLDGIDIEIYIRSHKSTSRDKLLLRAIESINNDPKPEGLSSKSWESLRAIIESGKPILSFSDILHTKILSPQPDNTQRKIGVSLNTVIKLAQHAKATGDENSNMQMRLV